MNHQPEPPLESSAGAAPQGPGTERRETDGPLCRCIGLHLSYGRHRVLDGCDLSVSRREVVGLAGENGSGKSTLVKCLLGFLRPSSGRVQCDARAGYCPQENYLHRSYTVAEHLELVGSLRCGGRPLDAGFVGRCVARLDLGRYMAHPIRTLSGGTYQKVKLLTAIAHEPPLLVLDEPTDGFDGAMYLVFWDLMAELVGRGAGVLMISHLLHERDRFDRIYELRAGRLHA